MAFSGAEENPGGASRNRTDVHGFAGRCITTLPSRRRPDALASEVSRASPGTSNEKGSCLQLPFRNLERETSLELATSTLARLRSTN
jgi:hypothetical protein